MLIIVIIIVGIAIGYLASLTRKRFPVWVYMLIAFLGALAGAGLSFGDSALFLKFPLFNIWTVPLIFSAAFASVAMFADRGKMMQTSISILIILAAISGLVYRDSTSSNYSGLFQEELSRAGVERVGQPIEGFDAFSYLRAFPGLMEEDFDGVQTLEGIYRYDGSDLSYVRTAGQPITSAEQTISRVGYGTFFRSLSERLGLEVNSEADIAVLLEKLREADPLRISYISDEFSLWYEPVWYPHETGSSLLLTHDESFNLPANTESYAIGPYIQVAVEKLDAESEEIMSLEDWFARNLWTDGSEFLKSKEEVLVNGLELNRIVSAAAGADGDVLHYVFYDEPDRIITLSQYPFENGGDDTTDFESIVSTFQPNYVMVGR